jgi:O-antigen/teichoic acid export membrane protein
MAFSGIAVSSGSAMFRRISELRSGGWSLGDQGLVSLGNFLTNVCLARNLPAPDYGIWTLLFGLLLFFYTIHASIVTYPLSVCEAKRDPCALRRVGTSSLLITSAMAVPFGVAVFAVSFALANSKIAVCCVLAMVCWYLQETLRRELMAGLQHKQAVLGDSISYLGQALVIFVLARNGTLSLSAALVTMAATSAGGAMVQLWQLGFVKVSYREAYSWFRQSCAMGGWATLANVSTSLSAQAFPWFLAMRGSAEAASFQSLANLVGVTTPVMLGISNLIIPAVSHDGGEKAGEPIEITASYGIQGALLILPYFALLMVFPGRVLSFLYGKYSPFTQLAAPLRVFVLAAAAMYIAHLACAMLYGLKQASSVFQAQVSGIPTALILGLPLSLHFGVLGACIGLVIVYVIRALISIAMIGRTNHDRALLENRLNDPVLSGGPPL